MRILFVTSHYAPSPHGGGYGQLCEEVADGLHARGHQVAVLTSTYGAQDGDLHAYPVMRRLSIDPDWYSGRSAAWQFWLPRRGRERRALCALREVAASFQPDVIYIWDAVGLPRELLRAAEDESGVPTAYYLANYVPELADEYLAYWRATPQAPAARLLKRPAAALAQTLLRREGKPVPVRYQVTACVSDYVRRRLRAQGLIGASSVVIHNGVDLTAFSRSDGRETSGLARPLRCLVAGRVDPEKGVHTVVQALGLLKQHQDSPPATLTILGDGPAAYGASLRGAVSAQGLDAIVQFCPGVPRAQMPTILEEHDALILASEYAEPLARAAQEAMAMGLLVIGTTTGGTGELLQHERTGLAFQAGNAASLAQQIERAATAPDLARRLGRAGRDAVRERFDIRRTVLETESFLQHLVDGKPTVDTAGTHNDTPSEAS